MTATANKIEKYDLNELIRTVAKTELGSISNVVNKLLSMLRDQSTNAAALMQVIEADPVLAAKLLRRVNSASYGLNRSISSIQESIVMVGFNGVKELALNMKVAKIFERGMQSVRYSRKALWKHSLAVALLSKMIYRREFKERGDDIYSIGLIHDIGIVAEEEVMPQAFSVMLDKTSSSMPITAAEAETFGYDHQLIGARLCTAWKLPQDMTDVIGRHHSLPDASKPTAKLSMALFIADHYCHASGLGFEYSITKTQEDADKICASLNIQQKSMEVMLADIKKEIAELESTGGLFG